MTIWSDLAGDVAEALAEYGGPVRYQRIVAGVYDASTGGASAPTPNDTDTKALILRIKDRDIDGTRIQTGDRRCIIQLAAEPTMDDIVLIGGAGGEAFRVVDFKTVSPAGETVFYSLQLRK